MVAEGKKLRFAMVCSSNMNRSMEAHSQLGRAGLDVESYGTGTHVKLPGPSLHEPNVYDFGTPYGAIYDDLRRKDPDLSVQALAVIFPLLTWPIPPVACLSPWLIWGEDVVFRVLDGVYAKSSVGLIETDSKHSNLLQSGVVARDISVSWRKII